MQIAQECHGIDIDRPSLEFLTKQGIPHLIWADVENLVLSQCEKCYDVIVAGEILEHLNNFGLFLSSIRNLMNWETLLIISVPNTPTLKSFFRALVGREIVHHDHVCYFSESTLKTLLARFKFRVSKLAYYCSNPFPQSSHLLQLSNKITAKFCKIFPRLADGLIVVARIQ
jgi:2-polyprenyl-3-methyl-5-hydroxy-6-metoxy-1,4-benzoquinol methylase